MQFKDMSTAQLIAIRAIMTNGVPAVAENKGSEDKVLTSQKKEGVEETTMEQKDIDALIEEKGSLAGKVDTLTGEKETLEAKVSELETKLSESETKVAELERSSAELTTEVEELRQYKADAEAAKARAEKIEAVKTKLTEAGIDDTDFDADYWLSMSEDVLDKTIAKLSDAAKTDKKVKSTQASLKVPQVTTEDTDGSVIDTVRQGLKERKESRGK